MIKKGDQFRFKEEFLDAPEEANFIYEALEDEDEGRTLAKCVGGKELLSFEPTERILTDWIVKL